MAVFTPTGITLSPVYGYPRQHTMSKTTLGIGLVAGAAVLALLLAVPAVGAHDGPISDDGPTTNDTDALDGAADWMPAHWTINPNAHAGSNASAQVNDHANASAVMPHNEVQGHHPSHHDSHGDAHADREHHDAIHDSSDGADHVGDGHDRHVGDGHDEHVDDHDGSGHGGMHGEGHGC